jgi:hypothetical protein
LSAARNPSANFVAMEPVPSIPQRVFFIAFSSRCPKGL